MSKNKTSKVSKLVLPAFLVSAGLFSAFLFPISSSKAVSSSSAGTELGATIIEYIRLALDTNTVTLRDGDEAVVAPSVSGTLATGNLNVAVTTNTSKGFSLGIYTQDETTAMTNPGVSATIPSVSGAAGYDASTGISSLATDTWGFRKKTGSDTYGNWFGVGADAAHSTVIENTNSSSSEYCSTLSYPLENSGCNANTYAEHTLNFGANLTSALPAGTYANNIIISAVAKSEGTTYTINFNANGGTGQMGTKSIVAGSTFTMPANTLITNEYPFLGYSFDANARTATYEPGDIVTVNDFLSSASSAGQDIDNALTLYLIWDIPLQAMQDFNCSTDLADGESTTLVDKRDNAEYTVKKFGTGTSAECWMTSNLTLGYDRTTNTPTGYTLTNELTNIPDNDFTTYYLPPAGKRGSTTSSSTLTSTATATFDGSNESQAHVQYRAEGQGGDQSSSGTLAQSTGYYNFWAASLGYSGYQTGTSSGNTPRDICPKGWQLPRGYNTSAYSFYWLDTVAFGGSGSNRTDTTTRDKYLNQASFLYSGNYRSSQLYYVGSGGSWWSSTVFSTSNSYYLGLGSSGYVYPQNNNVEYFGFAVRCVSQ